MTTTSPPPSSLRRSYELDTVRDVMLLETEEHLKVAPIARQSGAPARRGSVEARLGAAIAGEDIMAERAASLELAELHFERGLDLDRAVQLLHRALEIEDERELRLELARQLAMMGRHVEAGHVLRDGEPADQHEVVEAWLRSGDAYARAGEAMEAIATYREVAMLAPDDPRPFLRIAAIAHWERDAVPVERAADALLEAAKRYTPGSDGQLLSLARAFEVAPAYARSAEAYTRCLLAQGRSREADEVWREYGATSGHGFEVARRLTEWALARGDHIAALTAALDACIVGDRRDDRDRPLAQLLEDEAVLARLRELAVNDQPFSAGLLAAARTKSAMGRADALEKLAERFDGEVRALLLAFAAESYAVAGNTTKALDRARSACLVWPTLPRAHAALVSVSADADPGSGELVAALARLPPRAWLYQRVAQQHQSEGQHRLAAIHGRHASGLRTGDVAPLIALLDRASRSDEAPIIEAAIAQVLGHVCPYRPLAAALSRALMALAGLDQSRALLRARTVFETLGPGNEPLYSTLKRLAQEAGDKRLDIALTSRRAVSDEVSDDARAALYLEAAELCLEAGDIEGAAEHVYCAAAHSGPLEKLRALLDKLPPQIDGLLDGQRSDALLACAHATAWTAEQQDASAAIEAWRTLGALRWDLAGDVEGAEEAYFVACAHDPEAGPYRYARDLEDRAGAERAISIVVDRAVAVSDEGDDPALCGRLYAAAARVAADSDLTELAMNAALAAVQTDPSRGDAVAIVEKIARGEEGLAALTFVYNTLADAAMGRYGYRAAHYRAARQLETRHAYEHALRHAILAFEAVPSVGAAYRILLRLASRTGDEGAAVRTLAGVASTFGPEEEIQWLLRAAELAEELSDAHELRLDLLLRAFTLRQSAELVQEIQRAAAKLDVAGDEVVRLRLERAATAALPKLKGPRGARAAVALGVLAAAVIENPKLAVEVLGRALELDPRETDYQPLVPLVDTIAADRDAGRALLAAINEQRAKGAGPLASGLRQITSELYLRLSDVPPAPSSFPPAAERDANEVTPVSWRTLSSEPAPGSQTSPAEQARPENGASPEDASPEHASSAKEASPAEQARPTEEPSPAARAGTTALEAPAPPAPPSEEPIVETGQEELELDEAILEEEELLGEEEQREQASERTSERARRESDVEEILSSAEDVEIVTDRPPTSSQPPAARSAPPSQPPPSAGQPPSQPPSQPDQPPSQPAPTSAPSSASSTPAPLGSPPASPPVADAIDFSPASEQRARDRGDHEAIARMLAARARATPNLEQRRLIRLRRAAVLEQRLDQLELACMELETILEEMGEDATALRYLADLRDRMGKRARAARLWLRASKQAATLEEKLRDVLRCCEALVAAGRHETAWRLLEASRGLPQSAPMLELRVAVARAIGNPEALAEATAELEALGPDLEPGDTIPPAASAGGAGGYGAGSLAHGSPGAEPGPHDRAVAGRRVFRVGGAAPSASAPRELLLKLRDEFLERGVGTDRQAKETIRKLRAIDGELSEADRDVLTYLLVEALDRVQGAGAAMHELQQHWESIGGTPLVTAAVADRLLRRGDLKPALSLYDRVLGQDLQGLRSPGQIALEAAEAARQLGDDDAAERYLETAALHADARAGAERRYREWFGRPSDWQVPSERTSQPPPLSHPPDDTPSPPREALTDLDLDDRGEVRPSSRPRSSGFPSRPPPHLHARRPPTFPEFLAPSEEELFNELIEGSYEAGESLVALFERSGPARAHDVLAVRRYQAGLRRGDRRTLVALRDAALADHSTAFAQAIEHVLAAFDPAAERVDPPPLEQLAAQPEATTRLLLGSLTGTVNEALALVCESGMLRRELSDYDFTGTDRVAPVATTAVGKVYAALSRLLDLGGARLYHRSRRQGSLSWDVALVTPLAAILTGAADRDGPQLRYIVGSALAAATPPLALLEALPEAQAENLVGALIAGFGPVDERSINETSAEQMRMAEDLWHLVPSASDKRLRELCANPAEITYEAALANARATERRVGLFAAGDLVTAIVQVINELDLQIPRPIRGEAVLRELCSEPAIADLFDLAVLPEYAEARWTSA